MIRQRVTMINPSAEPELAWADDPTGAGDRAGDSERTDRAGPTERAGDSGERRPVRTELRVPDELALKWADDERQDWR